MRKLGLTGGIASGKSTVATMLREAGFEVIEADKLAHTLIEPGQPAYGEIVREFGASILGADGRVDRSKLAAIVFSDSARLQELNSIVHPRVHKELLHRFDDLAQAGKHKVVFVEAALLVEAGFLQQLDALVVAWCKPEQQLERLRSRGLSEAEARTRIAAQMPVVQKLKQAKYRIDCSGTLEETRKQVADLSSRLGEEASAEKE
jgi:dephospho-CoA kinase